MNISSKLKGLFAAAVAAVGITAFAEPGAVQLWAGGPYWATDNVGTSEVAGHPEYGGLYTWSDAKTAAKSLGDGWRLPTKAELQALIDNCNYSWDSTKQGGTFTSKIDSSRSIFLPAAGCDYNSGRTWAETSGYYWAAEAYNESYGWNLTINRTSGVSFSNTALGNRLSVRAVRDTPLPVPSVEITKAYQANLGSGVVNYSYSVKDLGGKKYNLNIKVGAKGCAKTKTVTIEKVAAGTATASVNVKELLDKAYPNVTLFAELVDWVPPAGQLWEDGPIFAECNVGASKPEEYGYYFWWGDTVGYKHDGSKWVSVVDGTTTIQFSTSDATANQTSNHYNTWLKDNKWIDDSGNLVVSDDAATNRDAARAKLGAPWRMMTKDELDKLERTDYCQRQWVTEYKGVTVSGWVVKGKAGSAYENNEVFFPAAGYGKDSGLDGSRNYYWSSSPHSEYPYFARNLYFDSGNSFFQNHDCRYYGCPVRAVRDAE